MNKFAIGMPTATMSNICSRAFDDITPECHNVMVLAMPRQNIKMLAVNALFIAVNKKPKSMCAIANAGNMRCNIWFVNAK